MHTKQIKKIKRILNREIKMYFSKEFIFRKQLLAWLIADIIKIIGLCFVWISASKLNTSITQSYVVTYYILMIPISKLTTDLTMEIGTRDIISGKFNNFLIKPYNYLLEYLGIDIGSNTLKFLLFIPAFIIAILIAESNNLWILDINFINITLSIIAITIGFAINFFIGNTLSLITMYVKEIDGIRIFYYNIASMLSGEFLPIIFLPEWGKLIMQILPFRYTLSFPIEILLENYQTKDLICGFMISILWLLIGIITYKLFYKHSIKKYEAEGI